MFKAILDKQTGDATDLVKLFREREYLDDIPDQQAKALCKGALMSLAVMRNELAGHGQGVAVVDVPQPYAALAIHFKG